MFSYKNCCLKDCYINNSKHKYSIIYNLYILKSEYDDIRLVEFEWYKEIKKLGKNVTLN